MIRHWAHVTVHSARLLSVTGELLLMPTPSGRAEPKVSTRPTSSPRGPAHRALTIQSPGPVAILWHPLHPETTDSTLTAQCWSLCSTTVSLERRRRPRRRAISVHLPLSSPLLSALVLLGRWLDGAVFLPLLSLCALLVLSAYWRSLPCSCQRMSPVQRG